MPSTARACTWVMTQTLNGYQPITDGTVYRRDQIPAGTFAEVQAALSTYSQHRAEAESGLVFLPVDQIPMDDADFTTWYRQRGPAFFGTQNEDFLRLVGLHAMEHKLVTNKAGEKTKFFDGFIPFGAGDNIMLLTDGEGWEVADAKLRSYGREAKAAILPWIVQTVQNDRYDVPPPPVAQETHLLRYKEATIRAHSSLAHLPEVQLPLGYETRRTRKIALIRDSGFLFRSLKQWKVFRKAVAGFRTRTGSGLELLTIPGKRGRKKTITQLLQRVNNEIADGSNKFNSVLNLSRLNESQLALATARTATIERMSLQARQQLREAIDASTMTELDRLTGLRIGRTDEDGQSG